MTSTTTHLDPKPPVGAGDRVDAEGGFDAEGGIDPEDPREQIEVSVLMANGRLAPRRFASRADAEAWAQPGEQVVEYNLVCACDM